MKTFRFREFPVYGDARKFRQLVRSYLRKFPSEEKYLLTEQINRSCLSIVLNIAEGSAKKSDKDFARFLEMAIASVNEVIAGFDLAHDDKILPLEELNLIENQAEHIAKQLGGFLKKLSHS